MTLVGQGPKQLTARQLPDLRVSGIFHHLKMTHLSLGRILPPPPGELFSKSILSPGICNFLRFNPVIAA